MTIDELQRVVTAAGLACRVKGDELAIAVCVFCGNAKSNLELNADKGVYHCWACRASGRLDALLTTLTGDTHNIPVAGRSEPRPMPTTPAAPGLSLPVNMVYPAAKYLARRGIDAGTAKAYGMVVCTEPGHALYGRILIPVREYWSGTTVGWVGRTFTEDRRKYLSSITTTLVSGWRRNRHTPVVVVEGHLDGIMVHRAGFSAAVLGGVSLPETPLIEWAARVEAPIIIMLDGDATEPAARLFWRLRALALDVRIAGLAPRQDPASLSMNQIHDHVNRAIGPTPTDRSHLA